MTTELNVSGIKEDQQKYLKKLRSNWLFKWMAIGKIPSLWFWKIRIEGLDQHKASVSIPFSWRTQNPFRSTYFGALCGAAELTTGLLVLAAVHQKNFSILVTHIEATYTKKAIARVTFFCEDGDRVWSAVAKASVSEPQIISLLSTGYLPDGAEVAKVTVTWSIKQRNS